MESKYLRGRLNFKEGIALIQNFVQSRNIVLNNKFEHKKENNSLRQSNFAKNQRGGI